MIRNAPPTDHSVRQPYQRSGRVARPTSAALIKNPPHIHLQRRVGDLKCGQIMYELDRTTHILATYRTFHP
jgi:hypothetical protein